jgi:hypothetical protein
MNARATVRVSIEDPAPTIRYWETVTRKEHAEPEKDLMLAVLKDAILTYRKNLPAPSGRLQQVERWLFERDEDRLFSFEVICFVLGLNPRRIRLALAQWKTLVRAGGQIRPQPSRGPRGSDAERGYRVLVRSCVGINSSPTERPGKPAASKYNVSPTT